MQRRFIPIPLLAPFALLVLLIAAGCSTTPAPAPTAASAPIAPTSASAAAPTASGTPGPASASVAGADAAKSTGGQLTVKDIAATAVAESVGEQCVASGPKPTRGFIGDPVRGKMLYSERGCSACHGDRAQGNVGPKLAGTTLPFSAVIKQLREPSGVMTRYLPSDQSDADECDVLIYVQSLK